MKIVLAPILVIASSLPFISCTTTQPDPRNTVFHQTDESPRTGSTQRRPRYGDQGTHSPTEAQQSSNRTPRRNKPSRDTTPPDPNGIVKPKNLPTETSEEPVIVSSDPPIEVKPKVDPPASTGTSEPPYAEAVPGQYGLVYSPFVADKKEGRVNVTDENNIPLPPGTEVTDPHTGKIFRVP